jgi:hypothetical protein
VADQPRTGNGAASGGPNARRNVPFSVAQARRNLNAAEQALKDLEELKVQGPALTEAKDAVKKARNVLDDLTSGSGGDRREARQDFMDDYYNELGGPWIAELVKQDPDLRRLFEKAIRTDDLDGFLDDVYQSDWWNDDKRSGSWKRAFRMEFAKDTTQWKDSIANAKKLIERAADSVYGITIPANVLDSLARRYMYQGWGEEGDDGLAQFLADAFARGYIGKENKPTDPNAPGFELGGSALTNSRTWRDRASAFGLDYGDEWGQQTILKILDPKSKFTEDDAWNQIIKDAESLYPVFAGKLSKDFSVRDAGAGYISELARLLEIRDPSAIDLTDPLLRKAFTEIDQTTKEPRLMPLWEFNQQVKKDERWQYTNNALNTYSSIGSDLARMMGFVG